MSTKFTPGPWAANCYDVGGDRPVGDSGVRFWSISPNAEHYRGDVASCHSAEHIGGITLTERDANAHLIAAAPDLYESLTECRALLDGEGGMSVGVRERADTALAKARGEA